MVYQSMTKSKVIKRCQVFSGKLSKCLDFDYAMRLNAKNTTSVLRTVAARGSAVRSDCSPK